MSVELTEALLSKAAGWEVMKHARAYIAQGQVLSSYWAPPLLRGVVQAGEVSFRASMVIKSDIDIENLCTCREAREWGKICAHGVGVGLHWLKEQQPAATRSGASASRRSVRPDSPPKKPSSLQRDAAGEPAELFLILPPNLDQALARGKVMLVFEAKWSGGRCPLNALPKGRSYAFSPQDNAILDRLEALANGETPAVLQLETRDFATLLPVLAEHPNITLGNHPVSVTRTPVKLPLRATLEPTGKSFCRLKESNGSAGLGRGLGLANRTFQPLGLPAGSKEVLHAPVRVPRAQVPQFLSQTGRSCRRRRRGSQFQTRGFHAGTATAAVPAGAERRPGPVQRAAAMRLRPAHHDPGRDGGG